jgi:hypothetical protein
MLIALVGASSVITAPDPLDDKRVVEPAIVT